MWLFYNGARSQGARMQKKNHLVLGHLRDGSASRPLALASITDHLPKSLLGPNVIMQAGKNRTV